MAFVQAMLGDPGIPLRERQDALERAFADPGIPRADQTTSSFWLKEPHPTLAKMQSPSFPTEADIVIIGSGITGTSVAKSLLDNCSKHSGNASSSPPTVVMLEARDICSGATGRNGGHILEMADEFVDFERAHGLETAKTLIKFRLAHLDEIITTAQQLDLTTDCQARRVQFVVAYFDHASWLEAVERIKRLKEALPAESAGWKLIEKKDLPEDLCMPHAHGVVMGPAGAVWPYKFVTGVLSHLKKQHGSKFLIETNTPARSIIEHKPEGGDPIFQVDTPRGSIKARHVVHCSNAHVGHLVPHLRGNFYPIRGQMSAQTAGSNFKDQGSERSWIFVYDRGFDYLTQLPRNCGSDGEMMLGGGFAQSQGRGIAELGVATDDGLSLYSDIHLSGVLGSVFGRDAWGNVKGPAVKQMWTGNMGFSADALPWVGKLATLTSDHVIHDADVTATQPGRKQWVAAAFSGEGMVNAWLCGKALAQMLMHDDKTLGSTTTLAMDWFPKPMLITEERLRDSRLHNSITQSCMNGV